MKIQGTHPPSRDAGEIDFRVVHVAAQVAAHAPCRPLPADRIVVDAR